MARARLDAPNYKFSLRGNTYYIRWWESAAASADPAAPRAAGRWRWVSTGATTQDGANRFLANFQAGLASPPPPPVPTIGQILDGYMAEKREEMTDKLYDSLVHHMKPVRRHLGDLDATNLTRQGGKLYARQRQAEGYEVGPPGKRRRKPVSDGTILREVVNLRAALNWAKREKWIAEAPYVPAPPAPPPKDRWLTREEFAKLLEGARSPHIKLFMVLALCTAARAGALLELPWSAVDLEGRRINLGRGKGNKGRAIVPINDTLLAVLLEAKEGAVQPLDGSPPTVIQEHGKAVKSIKTGFRNAVARAGLADVTPHVLRHTAATWMAMDGVDMLPISRFLGHRNTKVTEAVYASHTPEFLAEAARSLGLGSRRQ